MMLVRNENAKTKTGAKIMIQPVTVWQIEAERGEADSSSPFLRRKITDDAGLQP